MRLKMLFVAAEVVKMVKILVVDDEKDVCDFVKSFFEERGFKVFTASNGKEALPIAESEAPLIILMDIRMPHMDGIEALKHIKKKSPQNRVIMVTCVEDIDKVDKNIEEEIGKLEERLEEFKSKKDEIVMGNL